MLLSKQFTFLLGENLESVTVDAGVMSALSEPFNRLINGPMAEAQDGSAKLPDVENHVFLGLVDFAYRGDYNVCPCQADFDVTVDMESLKLEGEELAAEEEQDYAENQEEYTMNDLFRLGLCIPGDYLPYEGFIGYPTASMKPYSS
jgi:hypothetical protein